MASPHSASPRSDEDEPTGAESWQPTGANPAEAPEPRSAMRSAPRSSMAAALHVRDAMDDFESEQMEHAELQLEPDLFSNAFVSLLMISSAKSPMWDMLGKLVPVLAMFMVFLVQMVVAMELSNDIWTSQWDPGMNAITSAAETFVGTNTTLPLSLQVALCGDYSTNEMPLAGMYSNVTMPDGTVFAPDKTSPSVTWIKEPENNWHTQFFGTDRSVLHNAMYTITEGVSMNPLNNGPGYSPLFICIVSLWIFTILCEYRKIWGFAEVLHYFHYQPSSKASLDLDEETGKMSVVGLTKEAKIMGVIILALRFAIASILLRVGLSLLLLTTTKFALVGRGIALAFVVELDNIFYEGSTSSMKKAELDNIAPIVYKAPGHASKWGTSCWRASKVLFPFFTLTLVIGFSCGWRYMQVVKFQGLFNEAASFCLFAGPTPEGRTDIIAPVPGMCESLLSLTCAPSVDGPGAANGPCVVTNQGVWYDGPLKYYPNEIYIGIKHNKTTQERNSLTDWGLARPDLLGTLMWPDSDQQDFLRKTCLQMYQPFGTLSQASGRWAAPIRCQKQDIYEKVFSKVRSTLEFQYDPDDYLNQGLAQRRWSFPELRSADITDVVDQCMEEKPEPEEEKEEEEGKHLKKATTESKKKKKASPVKEAKSDSTPDEKMEKAAEEEEEEEDDGERAETALLTKVHSSSPRHSSLYWRKAGRLDRDAEGGKLAPHASLRH